MDSRLYFTIAGVCSVVRPRRGRGEECCDRVLNVQGKKGYL